MKPAFGELLVVPDAEAFAEAGARLLADAAATAGARCVIGLAGGSTPKSIYQRLASSPYHHQVRWNALDFVLGDERFVAPDDPDSNMRMIDRALFDHVEHDPARVHAVPYGGLTVEQAADRYEQALQALYGAKTLSPERPFFDLCFLGMGDDGHTASLLPGQQRLLEERTRWVLPVTEGRPEARVTLTYPVLDSARLVVFVVAGSGKRSMLDGILSGAETSVPAARIRPSGRVLWLVDRDAAGRWAQ
ncbi:MULTISPECIES: 6-phosphogluconolactonase [Acidiphilium]|uniref:6-phosphogluconolactonase n=1 Tax=Acidiphilium rubrum TaxID=526 RepID=A0A8G2FHB8_ACIRU|nr:MULTISPECIES: 6-phosphogluconolactonase [Acidiphilium]SIR15467.1 6-phosphogluconolactonase [Acidiphilium rubrum]